MILKNKSLQINLLIIIGSVLLFIPFLGDVHLFDWDEINFAESAREMIITGDYLNVRVNFELFWEKPPLFIWMQVLSMKIFGINEFAARFPNVIAGICTLLVLFNIGKKHFNVKMGLIWVFVYAGSVLPHFYFKSGIIDPWFNLFIFLGIYFFIRYLIEEKRQSKYVLLSAIFIGLGTLTKGPVALLVFLLSGFIFLIINKFKMRITFLDIVFYILTFIFIGGFWFILQLINGNFDILYDFVIYQIELFNTDVAGHRGFFAYHFVVLLIGVFPASFFAVKSFRRDTFEDFKHKVLKQWMMIMFWVVLILFSIVKTKIIHYSSLAYFPLTFLAAYAILKTYKGEYKKSGFLSGSIIFTAFVFASAIFSVQYFGNNIHILKDSGIITDQFALANLDAETSWSGFEFLIGVFLILGFLLTYIFLKKDYLAKVSTLFAICMLFTNLSLIMIVPEAEKISQGAAIEFYKNKKDENAEFITYAMKSYAHYFYGNVKYEEITGLVQKKTVYAVCRNKKEQEFIKKHPDFIKLYDKNGYVFFKKK